MIGEGAEANRMDGWDGDRGGKKKEGSSRGDANAGRMKNRRKVTAWGKRTGKRNAEVRMRNVPG